MAGRLPKLVSDTAPGYAYVTALRKWPEEIAQISRTQLAQRLGCTAGTLSEKLNNHPHWRATPKLLQWACNIIKQSGGTQDDQENWIRYHNEVAAYYQLGGACNGRPEPSVPVAPHAVVSQVTTQPVADDAAALSRYAVIPRMTTQPVADDAAALSWLKRLSDTALDDAAAVIGPSALHPKGIGLGRLYVPRNIESELIARLAKPSAHIVVGEPGYGKTSLLWSVHRALAAGGRQPFFIKATGLLAGLAPGAAAERAQALDLSTVDAALRACTARNIDPVLLVDTLDLLMHSAETRRLVCEMLGLAHRHGVRLVMTCRPGEAALLEPREEEAGYLRMIRLGFYDHGERGAAVTRYAEVFYRSRSGLLSSSDCHDIQQRVLKAVYHDLPLREVCDNPLTLRLLFELYAPHVPDEQVDVASLYDRYWELRVRRDSRAGEDGAADPAHTVRPAQADLDLRGTARTLARIMLGSGTPELPLSEARREIIRLANEDIDPDVVARDLELLSGRGVLAVSPDNATVRFFHQTFFEYAAAQFVSVSGRAAELIEKVCADPGDLLLAAVAAQAVPRLTSRVESDQLLCQLLCDDAQSAVTLGLAVYAHRPMGESEAIAQARRALSIAPADSVRRFLLLLPGIRYESAERWIEDLHIIWARSGEADQDLRVHLLETLGRLAGRSPLDAIEFLDEHDCLRWIRGKNLRVIRSHDSLYLRVLAPVYGVDPSWVRNELTEFCDLFVEHHSPQGVADILVMVREWIGLMPEYKQTEEYDLVLKTFAPKLTNLVQSVGHSKSAPAICAYGLLWAASQQQNQPDGVLSLLDSIIAQGPEPDPFTRARLYGVGWLARTLSGESARTLLAAISGIRAPGLQTAVLDGILVPLFAEDHGGETSMARELAAACRAALSELPAPYKDQDGSRTHPALFREAVERSQRCDDRLLELLPDSEGERDLWLRSDGLAKLVSVAAAAGHPVASSALGAWSTDPAHRTGYSAVAMSALHAAIMTPCQRLAAQQPRMLGYLIDDALLSKNPDTLVSGLDGAGQQSAPFVEEHRERLAELLAELVRARSGEDRRRGYRLWRALVANGNWPPPQPADLRSLLEGKPGTSLHIAALELCLAAVESGRWAAGQASELSPALLEAEDAGRAARRTAGPRGKAEDVAARLMDGGDDARHLRTAIACRTGDLNTPEQREAAVEAALDLALNGGYDLTDMAESGRFTRDVRQLGRLMERLLAIDPRAAAALLLRVSAALHAINPGIARAQREIANRWRTPLGQLLAGLGPNRRKEFMLDLMHQDIASARVAIEVFAQHYAPPPRWFRELSREPGLHPKLKETIRGNLFFHTRSHGAEPWRTLLG
jgi:hypothetical protein